MLSLVLFVVILIAQLLIIGAITALAARAIGSERGHVRTGALVALVLLVFGIAFGIATAAIPIENEGVALGVGIGLLVLQVLVALLVVRRAFRLSTLRALAPLGAYIAVTVIGVILVRVLFTPFVAEAFTVPTQSMVPTLEPNDRFIVNKLLTPRRWDLVVYRTTDPEPIMNCKRLVGLPGEQLRFDKGTLFVNGQAVEPPEVVAGHYSAEIADAPDLTRYRDGETIQLGDDKFFFVGDNVNHSKDSRIDGPTDRAQLVGVADIIYWPPGRMVFLR